MIFNKILELNKAGCSTDSTKSIGILLSLIAISIMHIELFKGVLNSWETEEINLDLYSLISSKFLMCYLCDISLKTTINLYWLSMTSSIIDISRLIKLFSNSYVPKYVLWLSVLNLFFLCWRIEIKSLLISSFSSFFKFLIESLRRY